ncbi:MAG: carbohydrate porin [Sedimentisphaerales bacterium]|nr:carbohydrate porin [Sedimentisphaerales bacterium]
MKQAAFWVLAVSLAWPAGRLVARMPDPNQDAAGANSGDLPPSGGWPPVDDLATPPLEATLGLTQIYQQNVRGGLSRHDRSGRFTGSYDLEIMTDLDRLAGMKQAGLYVHAEGSWPAAGGIDPESVGGYFSVNADAAGCRVVDVTELWYQQSWGDDRLIVRIGKLDLTVGFEHHNSPVAFDGSRFANDETTQFLHGSLVNNPTIRFPAYGLGAALYVRPADGWYLAAGAADNRGDGRETGFRTAFHDQGAFFSVLETGLAGSWPSARGPLAGTYRLGVWHDPGREQGLAGCGHGSAGWYVCCDQMLCRENDDPDDGQGFGGFARYGRASGRACEVTDFWSVGLQYQGLLVGRDEDVLATGVARGRFSDQAALSEDAETVWELYYNIKLAAGMHVSPALQYVASPAADEAADDALILALRAQLSF